MIHLPQPIHAAYFDVDGTLAKSNIVDPLLFIKKQVMSSFHYTVWKATLPFRFIYWTVLDKISREKSTASIYRQYKGISVDTVSNLKIRCYQDHYKHQLFSHAFNTVCALREQEVRIVLVSGSLDIFLQPLAEELGAELISSRLTIKNGKYTGEIEGNIVSGKQKSLLINEHAEKNRFDLKNCASFGDSGDDIPMLCSVGYPTAVNPDKKLRLWAEKNNWTIFNWSSILS
jgi:HAD superfamily hydrolase (TIGR01490 family)